MERVPVLPEFVCPLTLEVLRDPVLTADGHTYERAAITNWFAMGRRTSPMTNGALTDRTLLPNHALKRAIEAYISEYKKHQAIAIEAKELRARVGRLESELLSSRRVERDYDHVEDDDSEGGDPLGRLEAVESTVSSIRSAVARIEARQDATATVALSLAKHGVGASADRLLLANRYAFTASMLKAAGFTAGDCHRAGYECRDCFNAGFSARECKIGGFAPRDLCMAGFDVPEALRDKVAWPPPGILRMSVAELARAGYDVSTPEAARECGFTAADYRAAGYDAAACHRLGYGPADLRRAGFSPANLRDVGLPVPEYVASLCDDRQRDADGWPTLAPLRLAGFSINDVENFGYDAVHDDARAAGYTATEFRAAAKLASDARHAGFSAADLKSAGYSGQECRAAGYSVDELLPLCTGDSRKIQSRKHHASRVARAHSVDSVGPGSLDPPDPSFTSPLRDGERHQTSLSPSWQPSYRPAQRASSSPERASAPDPPATFLGRSVSHQPSSDRAASPPHGILRI